MGAFQGVAAGLGEGGEDLSKGMLAGQQINWQRQQASMQQNLEQQKVDIAKTGQAQNYQLAQQQHELYRQSLIDQGWKDNGVTQTSTNPDGTPVYTRSFVNMRDGSTRQLPVHGIPLDSPQASMNYWHQLQGQKDEKGNPVFSPIEAAQIAFKMPMLYRQGPAEVYKSFQAIGQDKFPDDPDKAAKTGKQLWDEYTGKAGYFHYGPGANGGRDMSGFSAGEKREYDAANAGLTAMENNLMRMANSEMANTLDPTQQQVISQRYLGMLQNIESQREAKFNEIQGRRGGKGGQVQNPSIVFSKNQWMAKHPGEDVNTAIKQATAAGAQILP